MELDATGYSWIQLGTIGFSWMYLHRDELALESIKNYIWGDAGLYVIPILFTCKPHIFSQSQTPISDGAPWTPFMSVQLVAGVRIQMLT